MDAIDRRDFLVMSSAGAVSLGLSSAVTQAATTGETRSPGVRMHGDGLGLSPAQYADRLAQLAAAGSIEEDYYSLGGSLTYGWVYAAVANHYLTGFSQRFAKAVQRSEEIFGLLDGQSALEVERFPSGTNVAKLRVSGVEPERFRQRLETSSIDLAAPLGDGSGFKIQVNETWSAMPPETIAEALVQASS